MVTTAPLRKRQFKPVTIGPTWQRERGKWLEPKYTIGWQIASWGYEYLLQPDGPQAGDPFNLTNEQARFLAWLYELDEHGRFKVRRAVLRRLKGWGKDPFGAFICAAELVGPCRFGGWNGREPIGVPNPAAWVQTVGVAKAQTKNTMTLFPSLFSRRAIAEYDIDVATSLIYAFGGARRIEAITSSADTAEGNRPSFVLMNETHHWREGNGGHDMDATIRRNLAKSRDGSARALAITNAHAPGEDSVAERDYEGWLEVAAGRSRATGILYDSLEAPPIKDLSNEDELRRAILAARGDSDWVIPERLIEEIYDPNTSPATARRFYLNEIHAAEDAWLSPEEIVSCARPSHKPEAGAAITLGLSGRKESDSTALMACEVKTGHVFTLGVWDAPERGEVSRVLVDAKIALAVQAYDVVGFYARLDPFQSWVETWEENYGDQLCARVNERHPIAFDERARAIARTKATEAFHAAVVENQLTHDGNAVLMEHLINARRRPVTAGLDIDKESRTSPNKIDGARAAIFARQARQDYLALPDKKQRQGKKGHGIWLGEDDEE